MKKTLLEFLVCPECYSEFQLGADGLKGEEIRSGILRCGKGHKFTIIDGVPRIVTSLGESEQVKESYSSKWTMFEDVAFSKRDMQFQFNWYISRYGFGDFEGLQKLIKSRSLILDAGCGVGRAVGWFSDFTDAHDILGIDISDAIDIAYRRYGMRPNVHLIQADILRPPFRPEMFDYISCDQVIHHIKNPEEAFNRLVTLLANGGQLAVYAYKKKGPIREFCDDYIRERTTKMSVEECMKFAKVMTRFGKALAELNVKITVPEDIPILEIKAGAYDLQSFVYWNFFKCFWDRERDYRRSLAVNFDWYHPRYAYRFTPEEVRAWFEKNRLRIISFDVIESGISVRGEKIQGARKCK